MKTDDFDRWHWLNGDKPDQPCGNFQPSDVGSWGYPIPHDCPECGGERYFCGNCFFDHHKGGWKACYAQREAGKK